MKPAFAADRAVRPNQAVGSGCPADWSGLERRRRRKSNFEPAAVEFSCQWGSTLDQGGGSARAGLRASLPVPSSP